MKRIVLALSTALYSVGTLHAQADSAKANPSQVVMQSTGERSSNEASTQEPGRILPISPIPVVPNIQDGPLPCPSGVAKPCALLGGRLYFSDPSHLTEHDATLGDAMKNPLMIAGEILNLAATVADIEGTQACLRQHTCTEGNPLSGRNPSRAQAYGTSLPLNLVNYALAGWMKKRGNGNLAFGILWGGTVAHVYEAAHGWNLANTRTSTTASSANRLKLGLVIRF